MFCRTTRRVLHCACLTGLIISFFYWSVRENTTQEYTGRKINPHLKQTAGIPSREISKGTQKLAARLSEVNLNEYNTKLTQPASNESIILLALVDTSFLDMTFNFYETSISKFNITNYLFIANDHQACEMLANKNINCYVYTIDNNANRATIFGTYEFNQKMNIRTFFILDALKFGFTVLHTDVDVVYFKNPLPDLHSSVHADIACLSDTGACNAGFVYIKPSEFAIEVYTRMRTLALQTKLDDQTALNKALMETTKKNRTLIKRKQMLDANKYQCGLKYFEHGNRYFAGSASCSQCVVVHNNWIVSKEAKRYRFREVLLWSYDHNGYYSNITTKYLVYSNAALSETSNSSSVNAELNALKTALYLGHVLNRVVILPRFHLADKKTPSKRDQERPLNTWIHMASFDGYFGEKYRENSFLYHEKVPLFIKQNATRRFWIKTNTSIAMLKEVPSNVTLLVPANEVTTKDIANWFGDERSAVLSFHSLYGVFGKDPIPKSAVAFAQKVEKAFRPSNYRQLKH